MYLPEYCQWFQERLYILQENLTAMKVFYKFLMSAPAPPGPPSCFFFFAFNFSFALLRSLFFSPDIPCLHTSAYLTKKLSKSSASTTVESLIFLLLFSFDLPFDARMRMGNGLVGLISENGRLA